MTTPEKLIEVALGEVGYLEKASASKLNDKTANAGSANYTKYGKWYGIQPGAWCAMFVSWCADQAGASKIIPKHASCSVGISIWQTWGRWHTPQGYDPQPGDVIYFSKNGAPAHVGIVTSVTSDRIYTVEGNTSGGNTVITNGGEVCKKDYSRRYTSIYGYGSPAWPPKFTDVPEGAWYTDAVEWAAENGILKGYEDGTFRPGEPVNRAEVIVMLKRLAEMTK